MKERVIGAIVLVIFVVLVVPVFLDGPPENGAIVSERVLLPGQEDQDTVTVVLDRERSEPIPAAVNNEATNVAQNVKIEAPPEAEEASRELPPTPPARPVSEERAHIDTKPPEEQRQAPPQPASSTTGMWAVQLGSFSNKANAEKLAADLRKQGYAAFLSQLSTSSGPLHRVRIGPQKDRESAERMAANLSKVKHDGQVVPHP